MLYAVVNLKKTRPLSFKQIVHQLFRFALCFEYFCKHMREASNTMVEFFVRPNTFPENYALKKTLLNLVVGETPEHTRHCFDQIQSISSDQTSDILACIFAD